MNKQELVSHYVGLRRRLEELHQACERVEIEIREVERELALSDVHFPPSDKIQDDAIIDHQLLEGRAGQPR